MYIYSNATDTSQVWAPGLYVNIGAKVGANSSGTTVIGTGAGWNVAYFSPQISLYTFTYMMVVWGTSGAGAHDLRYDNGAADVSHRQNLAADYSAWPDPFVDAASGTNLYGM